jgi:hypothetical protein
MHFWKNERHNFPARMMNFTGKKTCFSLLAGAFKARIHPLSGHA